MFCFHSLVFHIYASDHSNRYLLWINIRQALFWAQWIQPWGNKAPRVSLHSGGWTIRKINHTASTEDEKEKEAGSGAWRVKEGSESTLGCEGSAQRGCEQIWGGGGTQADLERLLLTEGGAGAGATGDVQGGQDREAGEQSENEGSEGRDRAGGAWGHSQ